MEKTQIVELIYKAIDEVNEQQDDGHLKIENSLDTGIFGDKGSLDSLGLVNFIVALQEIVLDELEVEIMLADEKTLCQENSPFRTVAALADYMTVLFGESNHVK